MLIAKHTLFYSAAGAALPRQPINQTKSTRYYDLMNVVTGSALTFVPICVVNLMANACQDLCKSWDLANLFVAWKQRLLIIS